MYFVVNVPALEILLALTFEIEEGSIVQTDVFDEF
jgi:hypothetical protein